MTFRLTITEAPDFEERIPSEKMFQFSKLPITIGRGANNDICLSDPTRTVSRNHAHLFDVQGQTMIEDLESKNFTYVNDERLIPGEPVDLHDGDLIQCGDFVLQVLFQDAEDGAGVDQRALASSADTQTLDDVPLINPFEDIVDEFIQLLSKLTDTYNESNPIFRDLLLGKAITRSTENLESNKVIHIIAESISKTGLSRNEFNLSDEEEG